jgi:hypothetical protein
MPAQSNRIIEQAIRAALASGPDGVVGLSCLAEGPDQLFARAVLDRGGTLEAVIPAELYRDELPAGVRAEYDALIARAAAVHRLPRRVPDPDAHMAAGAYMVDRADELWAVWDGKPARGPGGTADVVAYARNHDTPVKIIWPEGATRDS